MRPNYPTTILPEDRREVERYATSGHTHHRLDYHFVWRTKYSKSILGPVLSPFLVDTISAICKENHVKL
jgi:REP element-mobilizing transposase RayT